jgi:hypothetical protein
MVKKIFVLCTFTILFMAVNCDNEPYEGEIIFEDTSCLEAIETTEIASENFLNASNDEYNEFCLAYKEALLNQIEVCGDDDGILQILADNLGDCQEEVDLCEEAIEATELARIVYESAADEAIEDSCNAYKDALLYQIEVCGDDGTLLSIIEGLGSCETEVVDVVGDWILVAWNTDEARDLDNDGIVTNNYLDDIDCYNNETILFSDNGTGTMFLRSIAEFTYTPTIDGENFFTDCTQINEDRNFTWTETINTVDLVFTDGSTLSLFRNGNLNVAVDDGFYAESTVDNSVIAERVIFVYEKI